MKSSARLLPLWDLPTRIFHWAIVICLPLSWWSADNDNYELHQWLGYTVIVLVVARVVWGFVGSVHSRFADFVRAPGAVWTYLRGRGDEQQVGHNPAGGWSVLVMLLLLLVQALTGLFNSDELMHDGPFYHALDSSWTDRLGALHESLFWVLLACVGLHVASVLFYQSRRRDLISPMLLGGKGGRGAPQTLWRAALILCLCSGLLYTALYFAPQPELPW